MHVLIMTRVTLTFQKWRMFGCPFVDMHEYFATDGKKYSCEMTAPTRSVGWLTLRLRENKQDRI